MALTFNTLDFPQSTKTQAQGIDENGRIVGLYDDTNGVTHGFLDQNNTFTTIDDPLGTNSPVFGNSVATSVNNPGQIVGYYFDATGLAHGFLDDKGSFSTIDDPNGTKGTFAQSIAENHRIVGYYLDGSTKAHGFIDDKGTFTAVDFTTSGIPAGSVQTVHLLSASTTRARSSATISTPAIRAIGFLDDKGTFTTIHDPLGTNGTFVEGIADNKLIVGYYLDDNKHAHAFTDNRGVITTVDNPAGTDTFLQDVNDQGQIVGYYTDAVGHQHGFEADPSIMIFDTDADEFVAGSEDAYSGPVARLQHQFIYPDQNSVNIAVSTDNWFLHGGPGKDALQAHGGYNVLDGGTGSNFLTGGSGTDTFFVDDRSQPADIWSTVNGFHAGDDATVFGIDLKMDFSGLQWVDNQGAAGFTGLTLHVTTPGQPTASLTLPGYSTADLGNGRLSVAFGSEPDNTPFMHIVAVG